ncbi:uncharacterized protein LOC124710110 [Schistocerca piceifrons]|uniref:uncharacterized protein LOC124710110 n=1 Tax=Schistocerca piceifrons TaxID=274613 RepID=UPI001F5FA3BC|nr:uncharacterized protein LOC124710110 [Schistocerca piceifrons]
MAVFLTTVCALWLVAGASASTTTTAFSLDVMLHWVETCNKSYPISQEMLQYLASTGGILSDESDANARCYLECYDRLGGTIYSNGTINVERTVSLLTSYYPKISQIGIESVKKIIENCKSKSGTGQCMTAYLIKKCTAEGLTASSSSSSIFNNRSL